MPLAPAAIDARRPAPAPAAPTIPASGGLPGWRLRRVLDAIEQRLSEPLDLSGLAGVAGCSPTHLSRAFKRSTGLSPSVWLTRRRMARALLLLEDRSLSLAEIALSVGFAAQPQFTTAFRRVTGETPGRVRRDLPC